MTKRTVLIAGATGVVGHAALEHFARSADWNVIARVATRAGTAGRTSQART